MNASDDANLIAGLGDKLAKLSAVIEKLDKKANVVDAIEVFMAFSRWLEHRAQTDTELTPDLIKAINRYQDKYIVESMGASLGRQGMASRAEIKQWYAQWQEHCRHVQAITGTALLPDETQAGRDRRIRRLQKDYATFCEWRCSSGRADMPSPPISTSSCRSG